MKSPKTPPAVFQKQLEEEIAGGGAPEPARGGGRGAAKPAKPAKPAEPEVLSLKEFEEVAKEGQRVGVYWKSEDSWFDGKVGKVDRKGVYIMYDDKTEGYLDSNNTEIELL